MVLTFIAFLVALIATRHMLRLGRSRDGFIHLDYVLSGSDESITSARWLCAAAWVTVGTAAIL